MITGWRKLYGNRYYFGSDGAMRKSQWIKSGGYWHYCQSNGKLATGVRTINGSTYGFNKYGHMYTGKHVINGKTYHFGSDGAARNGRWVSSGEIGTGFTIPLARRPRTGWWITASITLTRMVSMYRLRETGDTSPQLRYGLTLQEYGDRLMMAQ